MGEEVRGGIAWEVGWVWPSSTRTTSAPTSRLHRAHEPYRHVPTTGSGAQGPKPPRSGLALRQAETILPWRQAGSDL